MKRYITIVIILALYVGFFAGMTVEKIRDVNRITQAQHNEWQAAGLEDECKARLNEIAKVAAK